MKFTQKMSLHLTGEKFSTLAYDVFADGKPTNLTRVTHTNGRPQYLKTTDKIFGGAAEFDVLATRGVGIEAWLAEHVKVSE